MLTRVLSLVLFGALAAALFLLPDPPAYRLAAMEAGTLLEEPARGDTGAPAGQTRLLWEVLVEAAPSEEGALRIDLGGSRIVQPGAYVDEGVHIEARRSLARGLRALLPEKGHALELREHDRRIESSLMQLLTVEPGSLRLSIDLPDGRSVWAEKEWYPPRPASLWPPVFAILLAILTRRPVLSLFSGVVLGAGIVAFARGAGPVESAALGLRDVFGVYLWSELRDSERTYIILFVVFMLAMVGIMTRSGGIRGLMDAISRFAGSIRRTQIAAWFMGLAVFFDDYANTILVGSTMRPLTDRFRIAREKLAYIVDSTAAPVAGLSLFSTWIAFEVSTFKNQLPDVGLSSSDGYAVFLQTLPYRFYCIFCLALVGIVVLSGRDFGPMLKAERRARGGALLRPDAKPLSGSGEADELEPAPGARPRMSLALWPLAVFLVATLLDIARRGGALWLFREGRFAPGWMGAELFTLEGFTQVLYDGSGSAPLMVGSGLGLATAALLAVRAGLVRELPRAAWRSLRSMGIAVLILYLAWMIGGVCDALGTAPYLSLLLQNTLPAPLLPCILFLLAGLVAFSTGSSWSTMSILLPLVVGLAFDLGETVEGLGGMALMVVSIGAVLEGAIFGDHCSPISDTTVMSSIASGSDHIDHVRTQAPYAILTMVVALLVGYFPVTFLGLHPAFALAAGLAVLIAFFFLYARRTEEAGGGELAAELAPGTAGPERP